jgi:hypothetical protein
VKLVSPIGGAPGGSGNLSTSLSNVARLAAHQNLCGFSTPTAMAQSFIITVVCADLIIVCAIRFW